jgi:hypothetical protein
MEAAIKILNRECKYNNKWCRYRYKVKMLGIVILGFKMQRLKRELHRVYAVVGRVEIKCNIT